MRNWTLNRNKIKELTALADRLSPSVGWENSSERRLNTASFNPYLPVIQANSADPNQTSLSAASDLDLY